MTPELEKVARAIAEADDAPWDELDEVGGATAVNPFGMPREHYRELALAAMEALMEPTKEMIDAGVDAFDGSEEYSSSPEHQVRKIGQAMLRSAMGR